MSRQWVEELELRAMLSITIPLQTGYVQEVLCGGEDDQLVVSVVDANTILITNGTDQQRITVGDQQPPLPEGPILAVHVFGGAGNDRMTIDDPAGAMPVLIVMCGGSGNDTLIGGANSDILYGDGDELLIRFGDTSNMPATDSGADVIYGGGGDDFIFGMYGNDYILGEGGNDWIYGDYFNTTILGGNDTILGGDGNDRLYGWEGNDLLLGEAGDDLIYGDNVDWGEDLVVAPPFSGNDIIFGGDGNDTIYGDRGNDILFGGNGDDSMFGGAGLDLLLGGAGNDVLYANNGTGAGTGRDIVIG